MRTVSKAPVIKPQNQIVKNGLHTTYITWRQNTLKDGKIVYHKRSHTYIRNPQRKKRVQTGEYKQLKTSKANELKKHIINHMDIFTVGDLDSIIQKFKKDPKEFKNFILR